jgi:hypothetical protein
MVPHFAMGELTGVSAKCVVVVPSGPMCMIASVVTILRGVRIRNADGEAGFTCPEITLPT